MDISGYPARIETVETQTSGGQVLTLTLYTLARPEDLVDRGALLNAQELLSRETVIMTLEAARWAEETLALEPHGRRGSGGRPQATLADVVADDLAEDLESEVEETAVAAQSAVASQSNEDGAVDSSEPTEESEESEETETQGDD